MTPSDGDGEPIVERPRKPYVAPKVIVSELYAKGVGAPKNHGANPTEFHSATTTSTS
ncbi:MAG TPA: hypothetical protein VKQ70_00910 [Caulobacteraceae bacterium]|jgi:hypothetical protein|nr:hypothetical protein [Caulobacteraceae bacterium]